MVLRRITVLVVTGLVLVGCGVTDDGQARTLAPSSTTDAPKRTEPSPTTQRGSTTTAPRSADPDDVVLTLDDLPSGWTTSPPDDDEDTSDAFCEDDDPFEDVEAAEAEAEFEKDDGYKFIFSMAASYEDQSDAEALMDAFAAAVDACREFTETDEDGFETTYRFEPLSFPSLGDDTYATRLTLSMSLMMVEMDLVLTRDGATIAGVFNGGLGGVDTALTERLLRGMADRM